MLLFNYSEVNNSDLSRGKNELIFFKLEGLKRIIVNVEKCKSKVKSYLQ